MRRTIEEDLPYETDYLWRYDRFRARLQTLVEMPDRRIDLLFSFLHQNNGMISRRARTKEFGALTDSECAQMEAMYDELFG